MRSNSTTTLLLAAGAAAMLAPLPALAASPSNPVIVSYQMVRYDTLTPAGLVETAQTTALGHTTKTRTDGVGRTLEQEDALGNVSTATYDNDGNVLSTRDANGVGQDCTYDQQNRRVACTDTQGNTRTTKYSVGGLVLNQQDGKLNWNTADAQYDARGRVTQITTRLDASDKTTYTYDANGNKLTVTDGEGKTTTYQYDNRNLKTAWTFPGQTSTTVGAPGYDTVTYEYDAAARLVAFNRQDGTRDETQYNFNGTVAQKTFKTAAGTTESVDTFTYDESNRPLTASKGRYNNTVAFEYDAVGRKAQESLTTGGNTYPVQYAYDADNRNTTITYPNGKVVTKAYTARNQLESASFDGQAVASATYDNGGRETSRTLGNGIQQSRTYRNDGLLDAITTTGDAASSLTYSYDANKNLTAETFGGTTAGYSATMSQDAKDRLTTQSRTNGDAQNWNLTKEGDWASQTTNGNTQTRTHNDNHQITAITGALVAAPQYDAQGDLILDEQGRAYTWDQEKQLTGIVGTGTNVGYTYDALGRRVSKTSNGNTTVFVSAGNQEIAEYASNVLSKTYVFGTYVDEVLAVKDEVQGMLYPIQDRRYSTTALSDQSGAIVQRFVYDPYGKTTTLTAGGVATGAAPMLEVLWTGRRLDSETGNYYFRSRYFNTVLGRFISRDIDYLDGWNLYGAYFAMSQGMDPSGETEVYDRTWGSCGTSHFFVDTDNLAIKFYIGTMVNGRPDLGNPPTEINMTITNGVVTLTPQELQRLGQLLGNNPNAKVFIAVKLGARVEMNACDCCCRDGLTITQEFSANGGPFQNDPIAVQANAGCVSMKDAPGQPPIPVGVLRFRRDPNGNFVGNANVPQPMITGAIQNLQNNGPVDLKFHTKIMCGTKEQARYDWAVKAEVANGVPTVTTTVD